MFWCRLKNCKSSLWQESLQVLLTRKFKSNINSAQPLNEGISKLENSVNKLPVEAIQPKEIERKALVDESNEDKGESHGCLEGWLNYRNELCFYGVNTKGSFFDGGEQCGLFNANFTSIHSNREFKFIIDNFDLREYWIGLVYGSQKFEDGTNVNPNIFWQIANRVPWADPYTMKGYICKAIADANRGVIDYDDFSEDI
ncbi:C-type lectin domain-containing protein [Meloidogyne graminicola]|uniref:C-type lectin domain-containing protein n=1 Tax=Meloidogyne graminicola TaxID=189291 RepID=A0A8S9ZFQ2_9BILA|nr:C-type lectin domain-containing protein [Meloidogyne graminicola]